MKTTHAIDDELRKRNAANRKFLSEGASEQAFRQIRELDQASATLVKSTGRAHDRIDEMEEELKQLREKVNKMAEWIKTKMGG